MAMNGTFLPFSAAVANDCFLQNRTLLVDHTRGRHEQLSVNGLTGSGKRLLHSCLLQEAANLSPSMPCFKTFRGRNALAYLDKAC